MAHSNIVHVGGNYLKFNEVEKPTIVQCADKCHIKEILLF